MGLIAITMGDPAGIGPELILKAFCSKALFDGFIPLVLGDINVLRFYADILGMSVRINEVPESLEGMEADSLNVLNLTNLEPNVDFEPGKSTVKCGEAVVAYIKSGVYLCLEGKVQALVTAPIHKESMHLAGYNYPGHTELLAELTGTSNYAMMLVGGPIRVVLVTIHVALKEVPKLITVEKICAIGELVYREMKRLFGIDAPRIAVCGLNPHAGEGGAFGDEEKKIIEPAVKLLREKGINATGPHPADTVFYWHSKGKYDVVLAMYHDQGLIPVKLAGFEEGVNITLGLPIIRTSPDHGTAFDIAGKGIAHAGSFIKAYELACEFAKRLYKP